jgi:hypothetical protein
VHFESNRIDSFLRVCADRSGLSAPCANVIHEHRRRRDDGAAVGADSEIENERHRLHHAKTIVKSLTAKLHQLSVVDVPDV